MQGKKNRGQLYPSPGPPSLDAHPLPSGEGFPDWNPLVRIAFRVCFIYFGLYALATQIFGSLLLIPYFQFRGFGPLWPMREITIWAAVHVFGITTPLTYTGDSIGETSFFWVQMFWILAVSITTTIIWSYWDRERKHYAALHKWFHLFIRLALASQMFEYGMTKGISKAWKSSFTYQRSGPEQLILDGDMDNHRIHMQLQLADFDTLPLLNSRFRWVRPGQQ